MGNGEIEVYVSDADSNGERINSWQADTLGSLRDQLSHPVVSKALSSFGLDPNLLQVK